MRSLTWNFLVFGEIPLLSEACFEQYRNIKFIATLVKDFSTDVSDWNHLIGFVPICRVVRFCRWNYFQICGAVTTMIYRSILIAGTGRLKN